MEKIEFTTAVTISDKVITGIEVHPLLFFPLIEVWTSANNSPGKPESALQRARIKYQTWFMAGAERVLPTDQDIQRMPRAVASAIIKVLDKDQGPLGKVISQGDGCTTSIVYKLGTPFGMKNAAGEAMMIEELEFMAETYGEVEDILACDNELAKAGALITKLGKPVNSKLSILPGWALDRLTVADGVQIMRLVLPSF